MASTQKKSRVTESKTGYIQNISPLKTSKSNRKYFNATLQTMTTYENIVSFKPESFKTFVDMAKAKTPVCLQNVDSIPSLKNPGKFDVKFSSFSKIESPKETITFPSQELHDDIFVGTVKEIKQNCSRFDKVTVTCKIQQVSDPETMTTKNLTKMTCAVSDHTDTIPMTVWNEQIKTVEKGKSYKFSNVSVRIFNEEIALTTNINSTIEEIEDIEEAIQVDTPVENLVTIDAVQVDKTKNCLHCKAPVQYNEQVVTTKCQACSKKMLTRSLKPALTVLVTIDSKDYPVSEAILQNTFPHYQTMSNDELEDGLLIQTQAKLCNNNIVGLVKDQL